MVAQLTHGDWEVESIDAVDEQRGVVYFSANKGDLRQRTSFPLDSMARISVAYRRRTALTRPSSTPRTQSIMWIDYSALMTRPTVSLCTVDGACNPFWQPRSVEAYNLVAPKFVDFKAADGTTALLGANPSYPRAGR